MRRAVAILVFMGTVPAPVWAQDVLAPGSTPPGDILRGQGYFLKGLGWYELNSARGRNIDTQTMILWNQSLKNAYDQNASERYARLKRKKENIKEVEADYARRIRENPNPDDIASGAALNALVSDLIMASYGDSTAWRNARVDLPEGVNIPALSFQFVPMKGDKSKATLSDSVICLSKLNADGNWPVSLRDDAIRPEQQAYVQAIRAAFEKCQNRTLDASAIDEVRRSLKSLTDKTSTVVKAQGGHREKAIDFLAEMEKAQKMFDAQTADFAEELIGDVQQHKAQTVEELIGFIRKYRLRFAGVGGDDERPNRKRFAMVEGDDERLYRELYNLLRDQKDNLGLKHPGAQVARDHLQPGAVWRFVGPNGGTNTLVIQKREGGKFQAKMQLEVPGKEGRPRWITGTIGNNKINWLAKDDRHIDDGKIYMYANDVEGIIKDKEIDLDWSNRERRKSGRSKMRLEKD